jgi:hypothetical protein
VCDFLVQLHDFRNVDLASRGRSVSRLPIRIGPQRLRGAAAQGSAYEWRAMSPTRGSRIGEGKCPSPSCRSTALMVGPAGTSLCEPTDLARRSNRATSHHPAHQLSVGCRQVGTAESFVGTQEIQTEHVKNVRFTHDFANDSAHQWCWSQGYIDASATAFTSRTCKVKEPSSPVLAPWATLSVVGRSSIATKCTG